jgi:membrane protein
MRNWLHLLRICVRSRELLAAKSRKSNLSFLLPGRFAFTAGQLSSKLGNGKVGYRTTMPLIQRLSRWELWSRIYDDVDQKHLWPIAAALSFYSLLSLFPGLILFSAAVSFLPGHSLFDQAMGVLAVFLPRESMRMVTAVLEDVITPNRGAYFSVGFIGTVWTASNSLSASIEALNIAYGVPEKRPFWKTRLLALVLAVVIGGLLLVALTLMIIGPKLGGWIAARLFLSALWLWLWPIIHWTLAVAFTLTAIEALYLLAPNRKPSLPTTLPGAVLAVGIWLVLSSLLGIYFRHVGDFHKTYGTLGVMISLLIWLYWTGFAILLGAELNGQIARMHGDRWHEPRTRPQPDSQVAA